MSKAFRRNSIIGLLLNLILGVNFLLSAYAKLPAIEVFGWTIAESTPFSWTISEWLARIFIGLELFLGILFLSQFAIKKITIPLSTLLLIIFSIYLVYVLTAYGNEANCGCYGELIPLSTSASLFKNIIILILLWLAYKFSFELTLGWMKYIIITFFLGSFILPFALYPPASIIIFESEKTKDEIVPLHLLTKYDNYIADKKKIIALLSPSCKYCKKAARRMSIIKKRHPEVPFQFVMFGHPNHLAGFLEESRATNIPLIFLDNADDFQKLNNRNAVPTIKWLNDSTIIKTSTYFSLSESEILDWLNTSAE